MAVYVPLTKADFAQVAVAFGLGAVRAFHFIPQGSINTNAWLECSEGRFFVRHTTVRGVSDLSFEAALLDHLAQNHFPAPVLCPTLAKGWFMPLAGGWISLFLPLSGEERTRESLTPDCCERLGTELGRLHRFTQSFGLDRANPYGPEVVEGWIERASGNSRPEVRLASVELASALELTSRRAVALLPRGVIHADLFTDNVKWLGDSVSAVFDFEMACREVYVLDLAITLNAWCYAKAQGGYQDALVRALVRGYQSERPLTEIELQALHLEALFGAVRFTASRIRDFHLSPLPADRLAKKDYTTYLARVRELMQMGESGFRQRFLC